MSENTALVEFTQQITETHKGTLENLLGKREALKFISAMSYCIQSVPELLTCEKLSLQNAFMKCAELNLYPSSVSGEAYVLPYKKGDKKEAQFQLGYQGIITLLYRAGVSAISSEIVYEKDVFEYEEGLNPKLVHKPDPFKTKEERGKAIGVYAIAVLNGQKLFHVMGKGMVGTYREFSKSKNSTYSPWNSDNDPELWMWRKTCIKQLAKTLPKNSTFFEAIKEDNDDSELQSPGDLKLEGFQKLGAGSENPDTDQK